MLAAIRTASVPATATLRLSPGPGQLPLKEGRAREQGRACPGVPDWVLGTSSWVFLEAHSLEVARAWVCPLVTARWQQCRTLGACRARRGGVPLACANPGRGGVAASSSAAPLCPSCCCTGVFVPKPKHHMKSLALCLSPAPHMLLDWWGWELKWGDAGGDYTGPQPFLAPPDPQSHGEDLMRGAGGQLTGALGGYPPALSPPSPQSCGRLLENGVCSLLWGSAPHAFSVGTAFRSVCVPSSTHS